MDVVGPLKISKDEAVYTSCYCEENVWKLCEWIRNNQGQLSDHFYAVFISNDEEKVPIWKQKSGDPSSDGFVVWDYHVILVYADLKAPSTVVPLVYDLDSSLSFPAPLACYLESAICDENSLRPEYHRYFRFIPATQYLDHFASDRRRMRRQDGSWIKDPPNYPPIKTENCTDNLSELISMDQNKCNIGQVMNLKQLRRHFLPSAVIIDT